MPRPIDIIPGLAPERIEQKIDDDLWRVTVRPPPFMGTAGVSVNLTQDQFDRYRLWRAGGAMIQDALPDLTPSQREGLMSGLSDDEFSRAVGDDDD